MRRRFPAQLLPLSGTLCGGEETGTRTRETIGEDKEGHYDRTGDGSRHRPLTLSTGLLIAYSGATTTNTSTTTVSILVRTDLTK
jgi:hypothetical protein